MKCLPLLAAAAALLIGAAPATSPVSEKALRRHIAVLASDRLEGRKPGTPGGLAAETYIQRQFERIGLSPGARDGGWLQPVRLPVKDGPPIIADNVIARIDGSDPAAGTVLFMAHWDHLGLCAPATAADRVCNGAVDNASGVASLIEIARGLARGARPVRDILFVATTGEERGLLGARAFAADPPLRAGRIVAAFNLDTVAVAPRGQPVLTIGRGMTPLDPIIDETARALGREVDASTRVNDLVRRQDGWALMQAGIPAVLVGGAFGGPLQAFLTGRYHHPDDELAAIVLGGAAEDANLLIAIGRAFADPARYAGDQPFTPPLDSAAPNH